LQNKENYYRSIDNICEQFSMRYLKSPIIEKQEEVVTPKFETCVQNRNATPILK
jgi:hypothetical protein